MVFGPAWGRGPDSRRGYGGEQLADGPLRPALARDPLQLRQGPLAGWPWQRGFAEGLGIWASALQWTRGSSQVTYAKLALDFESHSNRALLARPGHRHAWHVLSLREQPHVLQPLLAGGTLLEENFRQTCASPVPLQGLRTERLVIWQHMQRLHQHCLRLWTRRLSAPEAGHKDYFLEWSLPRRPGSGTRARRPQGEWE